MTNSNETESAVRPVAVLILPEWKANIDLLTDDRQVARVMRAFVDYTIGVEADLSDDVELRQFWHGTVLPKLRENRSKYLTTCDERSNAGKLSGESRRRKLIEKKGNAQIEQNEQVFDLRTKRTKRTNCNCIDNIIIKKEEAVNVNASTNNHGTDPAFQLELPGLPDGKPAHKVRKKSRKKWTIEEFRSDVLEAGKAFPDFSPEEAKHFIGHYTQIGNYDLGFREFKLWDSAFQIENWLKKKAEFERDKAAKPAMPAKKPETPEEINRRNAEEQADYLRRLAAEEKEVANVTTA